MGHFCCRSAQERPPHPQVMILAALMAFWSPVDHFPLPLFSISLSLFPSLLAVHLKSQASSSSSSSSQTLLPLPLLPTVCLHTAFPREGQLAGRREQHFSC